MNNLVVFAHPNQQSFCKGIVDTVVKASKEAGANVKVRDLYQMQFCPLLKPDDFVAFQSGGTPADIKEEQDQIKWADVITFVFPVWWASMPAILKGYIDRVFSYGFAYEYVDGAPNGLLKGKKVVIFSTTGTPNEMYAASGMHKSMEQTIGQGIFNFSGIKEVDQTFFGAVPYVTDEIRKDYLGDVSRIITQNISHTVRVPIES
ncbi:NAD(P)H-dependent oxidoreductase [Clostridium fungisolvens]|uniref:General stress protein 14 n=1 Tax=Clostridium fungisolvens TaxID=1604897 RepID=A0A6V8SGM9_9CLOT|nr:NAD(P)H-dependent oxidoreductase [Clostridium fungisolvens]GFP74298.1 General stress protein 14 [Clostridium fungisolvens]